MNYTPKIDRIEDDGSRTRMTLRKAEEWDQLFEQNNQLLEALRWAMGHVENVFALANLHDREREQLERARRCLAESLRSSAPSGTMLGVPALR